MAITADSHSRSAALTKILQFTKYKTLSNALIHIYKSLLSLHLSEKIFSDDFSTIYQKR